MSLTTDILDQIEVVDDESSATAEDITGSLKSDAWASAAETIQSDQSVGSERSVLTAWTAQDEIDWGLDHFKTGIRDIIKSGKVVMPYKCLKDTYEKLIIITRNKVYKFPTNNVNYFNATLGAVVYYGAEEYFLANNESSYATEAQNSGNAYVSTYNYQST